jgi:hypothetical protein
MLSASSARPARRRLLLVPLLALSCFAGPGTALAATNADLAVTAPHQDGDDQPVVGGGTNYSVLVTNNGPDFAAATVTLTLGDAEELVSADAGFGQCTQTNPVVCTFDGLGPGQNTLLTAQVRFTKASTTNVNRVQISGANDNTDPDPANNEASASAPVLEQGAAQNDPQVATGEWSRTQSRLKVDATVTPYGAGQVFFEYGKTKSYGHKTAARKVSGDSEKTVKSVLTRLKMNTVYHYRAVLVVEGKTYRGKDVKARTMGKLLYGPLTLKAVARHAKSVEYVGKLGDGYADAPGACNGKVSVEVYTLQGATLLRKSTRMHSDCTYKITIPFGRAQASRYGKRGSVLTQAFFMGSYAVAHVGSDADRP